MGGGSGSDRLTERESALLSLVQRVVARAEGDEAVEAFGVHTVGASVHAFDGEIERLVNAETRGIGVRVIVDGRVGFASTSDLSDEGLTRLLAQARGNVPFSTPDVGNVLPAFAAAAPLPDLVDPDLADVAPERKVALALELERLVRATDRRIEGVETSAYGDGATAAAIASTSGLAASYSRTNAFAYVSALARVGEETQTAFGFTDGRGFGELDIASAAAEAADRALALLGATRVPTATVPVVFDPLVTSQFLGVLAELFSAEAVQKGRSMLAGHLGEPIAAGFSLIDDGRFPRGLGSAPFDDEGVPTGRTVLLDEGVLSSFLHDTETAARAGDGTVSTGNAARSGFASTPGVAPSNLFLDGPSAPPHEVIEAAGDGFYVQSVSGVHSGVNVISGEFSVGATGFWIRGGQLAEPVREVTVSSTIPEMLGAVRMLGDDRRFFPFGDSVAGCTLLLESMTVAGS